MRFFYNIKQDLFEKPSKRSEIIGIVLFALALFLLISITSFDYNDLSLFSSDAGAMRNNFAGIFGAYFGGLLVFFMGLSSYAVPALVLFWAIATFSGAKSNKFYLRLVGILFFIFAISSLFSILGGSENALKFRMGGFVGLSFSDFLIKYMGFVGALVAILVFLLLSVLIATDFLILPFLGFIFSNLMKVLSNIKIRPQFRRQINISKPGPAIRKTVFPKKSNADTAKRDEIKKPVLQTTKPVQAKIQQKGKEESAKEEIGPTDKIPEQPYSMPEISLLKNPVVFKEKDLEDDLEENSRILEETLKDFDIEAKVIEVNRGPVITRYELEPASGIKVHKITSLSDNIALAMKAESIRIVAPIPGKGTIGVEVPNLKGTLVCLKELIESTEYTEEESKLKLALGKTISGDSLMADLGVMPHLLIAGATGSGKTVCVNTIICSMLYNAKPEEIKFIMVDPKKVELAQFNNLPHLLCPVITDYKIVPIALEWLVNEMTNRYSLFQKTGVRNIEAYIKKAKQENWQPLSYIVIIIDELADLMLVSKAEIESAITRLAQLSRAVGIHMILATQRPSVNVITGVIKANFPSRISFKVASKVDSRTVLDRNGAEKLLGRGDMLFIEPGDDRLIRAQGSLVSDEEIEKITDFIKKQRKPEYIEEITKISKKAGKTGRFQKDEIYHEAVRLVIEAKQASVSMLQRKLGVGYTKAARLMDMMEEENIVGPYQGSKPRDILVESAEQIESE